MFKVVVVDVQFGRRERLVSYAEYNTDVRSLKHFVEVSILEFLIIADDLVAYSSGPDSMPPWAVWVGHDILDVILGGFGRYSLFSTGLKLSVTEYTFLMFLTAYCLKVVSQTKIEPARAWHFLAPLRERLVRDLITVLLYIPRHSVREKLISLILLMGHRQYDRSCARPAIA